MIYIGIGILGFLIIHMFDIVSLKKIPIAKPAIWTLGCCILLYSLVMMFLDPNKLPLPVWSNWIGWGLLIIAGFLLIYSLFINLPFRKTYINIGVGDKLVVTGFYALVRHPGVPWFVIVLIALVLASRSQPLLIAAPVFALVDILLVVIQDKVFFTKMFASYTRYQKETPMLLPNRKSIGACIRSLGQNRVRYPGQ